MHLFGSSGIRLPVDQRLLDICYKASTAVGLRYHRVIVGRDTRTSSDALKHAVMSALMASGAKVFDAGLLPTPSLALAARKFDVGLMVTASHNPPEYNGLKFLNPDGSAFSPQQQLEIEQDVSQINLKPVEWDKFQNSAIYHGAIEQHINHIRRYFPGKFQIKVVLDCGCGAGSAITPYLLQEMGCEVLSLNSNPSGFFPHPVEPLESNLQDLIAAVKKSEADLGLAHDGDADRLVGVDGRGKFINGDKMLCLFARSLQAKKVVTTVDASMSIEQFGYTVRRTPVGDSFVSEELKSGGEFGGEPSGAWIFPQNSLCPDGIFAAGLLVSIASQGDLNKMIESIPSYPSWRSSIANNTIDFGTIQNKLISVLKPTSINHLDGMKLGFREGWLLVRPSGTEPKIRLTVEGNDPAWAKNIHNQATEIISGGA